jgi:hypothetical protein
LQPPGHLDFEQGKDVLTVEARGGQFCWLREMVEKEIQARVMQVEQTSLVDMTVGHGFTVVPWCFFAVVRVMRRAVSMVKGNMLNRRLSVWL